MTLQEFKAWFEGFTEELSGAPNKKQWERIKKRVKEINGMAVTYPVFVDRYWPGTYTPIYTPTWITTCGTVGNGPITSDTVTMNFRDDGHSVFNSSQAMLALGKADYQSLGGLS